LILTARAGGENADHRGAPAEILLGDAVTGTATKAPMESFVSSARAYRARQRDRFGYAMLAQPRATAIKVMRTGG